MKKVLFLLMVIFSSAAMAQQDVQQLLETARSFQRQADYDNAILVLKKAQEANNDNTEITRELAFSYYLQGRTDNALTEIKKIIDKDDADEQTFQIAGNIYKSKLDFKEGDKLFKKGLKKFPNSGAMYNDYGEILYQKEPGSSEAAKMWEKGIEMDPNFSRNYYNAARYYGTIGNNLWALVYGELFVNLESYSTKTIEIKHILFDIYKQWFVSGKALGKTPFEEQFAATLNKQNKEAGYGLTPESLTAIRTRFILDWFNGSTTPRPAFRLFDLQKQLLQDGLFEAYNQWLFGSIASTSAYQNWVSLHAAENNAFIAFQRGRVFKVPAGQYYAKP